MIEAKCVGEPRFLIPARVLLNHAFPTYVWDYIASGCVLERDMDEIGRETVEQMIDSASQVDPYLQRWIAATRITRR